MPRRSLLGAASAIAVACSLLVAAAPADAQGWDPYWYQARPKPRPRAKAPAPTEQVSKEPFGPIPSGPLQIIISIDQQKLHLYSDGKEVTETLIATGVPQHPTPIGVFSIIEKDILHHSNIYSGAPMPFMQRITWSGVALHEGVNLGHPASHGCIRMPREFAARLWVLTKLGVRVIIARPELHPDDFADTRLFVHMDETHPVSTGAAPATEKSIKTAETIDGGKSSDAMAAKADDALTHALTTAKALSGGATTKMDGIASGIGLRSTIGAEAPTQIAAGEPIVPSTTELPPDRELNATGTPAAAPAADPSSAPAPAAKPSDMAIRHAPISIFVSAKDKKIYVRQDFVPLFSAPITIAHPEQRFGTHVFTAMDYLDDHSSFRWNVVSLPAEAAKMALKPSRQPVVQVRYVRGKRVEETIAPPPPEPSPLSAQEVLARIEIPQDVIERISQLIIPGSSLIISDHGLGEETGAGTDFIVVAH